MERLVDHIDSYLRFLNSECKLCVSVHFPTKILQCLPQWTLERILSYNTHTNPYCMSVKRCRHHLCVQSQKNLYAMCGSKESFERVCYAGVREYIYPIRMRDEVIGFAAVSGYRGEFPASGTSDFSLWEKCLSDQDIPIGICRAVLPPLAMMMEQLFLYYETAQKNEYNLLLQYLNEYYADVTIDDLCSYLGRSKSHISHMFKHKSGMSVREYCNQRKLEDAKRLLAETDFSVTQIAFDVGFHDVSYFIAQFRGKYGISPLRYRKNNGAYIQEGNGKKAEKSGTPTC